MDDHKIVQSNSVIHQWSLRIDPLYVPRTLGFFMVIGFCNRNELRLVEGVGRRYF